jgi:transposase
MRGEDLHQDHLYSYVSPEQRVPADHPLRPIRHTANTVLERLSPKLDAVYSAVGRRSIPPEKLLRALLLQVLYTLRSELLLMEELDYNLLFRWFVGLNMDDPVWDATVYCKNRERLLKGEVAQAFFAGGRNLWLVQDRGLDAQDAISRLGTGGLDVHLGAGGLQYGPPAQSVAGGGRMRERCLQSAKIALSGATQSPPGRASNPYLSSLKTLDSAEFYF